MAVELAAPAGRSAHEEESGALIRRGAQLVDLCEELHIRMFSLALVLLGVAGVVSIPLALANPLERPDALSAVFCAAALLAAGGGLVYRRPLYLWLRHSRPRQLAPGLLAAAIVVADGPYSPCWWVALALALVVATAGTAGPTLIASLLAASGYAAGTLLRGASLLPGGDGEYLTVLGGLLTNPLLARALTESFARFVLRLHRLEGETVAARRSAPAALLGAAHPGGGAPEADGDLPSRRAQAAGGDVPAPRRSPLRRNGASRLTARQLEVALLARDGLRQAEIAAALGISARQVGRHLEEARQRSGAATTAQLVAMLVEGRLAPPIRIGKVDGEELPVG